jgi:uncharacterized coiled-coil DUF342 family protein
MGDIERTPEQLLDELVATTRARDKLADTADRLIGERDEARQQLRGAVEALQEIALGNLGAKTAEARAKRALVDLGYDPPTYGGR